MEAKMIRQETRNQKQREPALTIFLTGGTGVLGQAVLEEFRGCSVIGLAHNTPLSAPNVIPLPGNLSEHRFGLSRDEFNNLAKRINCIVHSAAVTNFSLPDEVIFRTNVHGTQNVLDLAATAGVPLYHMSTAFVHPRTYASGIVEPNAYELSKKEAERVVKASGLPSTILRPSIIVGHSQTGAIRKFQGLHLILGLYMKGDLHVLPASPRAYIDFVPQNIVAAIVAAMIKQNFVGGDYWLTAGPTALTLQTLVDICAENAPRLVGRPVTYPRMVTPDIFDRLIRPVFLPALPRRMQQIINRAVQLSKYMTIEEPLPTSLSDLQLQLNLPFLPPPELTFLHNIEYWAAANGYSTANT